MGEKTKATVTCLPAIRCSEHDVTVVPSCQNFTGPTARREQTLEEAAKIVRRMRESRKLKQKIIWKQYRSLTTTSDI